MHIETLVLVVCPNHDGFHEMGHDHIRYAFYGNGYMIDNPTFMECRRIMRDWCYTEVTLIHSECRSCIHKRGR
jgi:hypothetical protein